MASHEVDSLLSLDLPKCTCGARQSLRAVGFYRKSTNVLYDNYVHHDYLFKRNMVVRGVRKITKWDTTALYPNVSLKSTLFHPNSEFAEMWKPTAIWSSFREEDPFHIQSIYIMGTGDGLGFA